ncbi:hypothetical protein [Dictyobacter arantiisoli]|uniref:YggT family protein n=1 Tax=Dictyobacter arantiisoli TaxID=2014874 RepID=A0A5A5T963_9CHLR|nr:hypothetical protein [Dictyobacter arantiisoli]GCF07857.1 hypothetical protein KDI_14210 [Dictyobacter arantiisoli]
MEISFRKKVPEATDEHDLPTEPVSPLTDPSAPRSGVASRSANEASNPVPSVSWQPFYAAPPAQNYPILPTFPTGDENENIQEQEKSSVIWQLGLHIYVLKMLPLGVGCCFVALQLVLVTRFICKALLIDSAIPWINSVYGLSEIALLPFRALLPSLDQAFFLRVEPYTIVAIVCYGLCSRLLVRLLKMLIRIHVSAYGRAKQTMQMGSTAASDLNK